MSAEATIRMGPQPGDLGAVLTMHGEVYAAEYGFDEGFEAHVARGLAAFAEALGAAREGSRSSPGRLWVAERDTAVLGTIALTDEGGGTGQVRWFLIRPEARGGLGRVLLDTHLEHARAEGFQRLRLWTVDRLEAAAHLYTRAGFRCVERRPVRQWGHELVEARYELDLRRTAG